MSHLIRAAEQTRPGAKSELLTEAHADPMDVDPPPLRAHNDASMRARGEAVIKYGDMISLHTFAAGAATCYVSTLQYPLKALDRLV